MSDPSPLHRPKDTSSFPARFEWNGTTECLGNVAIEHDTMPIRVGEGDAMHPTLSFRPRVDTMSSRWDGSTLAEIVNSAV